MKEAALTASGLIQPLEVVVFFSICAVRRFIRDMMDITSSDANIPQISIAKLIKSFIGFSIFSLTS
jgi:hypothetical protein